MLQLEVNSQQLQEALAVSMLFAVTLFLACAQCSGELGGWVLGWGAQMHREVLAPAGMVVLSSDRGRVPVRDPRNLQGPRLLVCSSRMCAQQ